MKITQRLMITTVVGVSASVFVSAYALWQLKAAQGRFDYVTGKTIPALVDLEEAVSNVTIIRTAALSRALLKDPAESEANAQRIADAYRSLDEVVARYATDHDMDDDDKRAFDAHRRTMGEYRRIQADFLAVASDPNRDVGASIGPVMQAATNVMKGFREEADRNIAHADRLGDEGRAAANTSFLTLTLITILAVLFTGLLSLSLYVLIRRTLNGLRRTLSRTSQSLDLTERADSGSNNEVGETARAYNSLVDRIEAALCKVNEAAASVGVTATQIMQGNLSLSDRTQEQAASLEETAATMEQFTSTVRVNSDNAKEVSALAGSALDVATQRSEVVSKVVHVMAEIDESSLRIAGIIGIIEGIAFQTNILALNAAVEAARAGEHGRSFAVVASEVRTLAQRSSTAAKEIKELVEESLGKVHTASSLVVQANDSMGEITKVVAGVAELAHGIALASEEQSRGIEQINQAISEMDSTTQQNAALVEQATSAAHELESQGSLLRREVAVFRTRSAVVARPVPGIDRLAQALTA